MKHLYPISLKLENKNCLIIGGGRVAQRKIKTLLEYDACIKVVSPHLEEEIFKWAEQGRITLVKRSFLPQDLDNIFMVFIATNDNRVNTHIANQCKEKGIMANVVDDPGLCDFYVPSILRRKSLCLAISTEGKSPAFARWLRRQMENYISEEYGEFVEILGEIRPEIKDLSLTSEDKKRLMEEIINSDWLQLLEAGDEDLVMEQTRAFISSWQHKS